MSIPLPPVDLSVYPVGSTGFVDLSNAGLTATLNQYKTPAHIQIYNESGSGLSLTFSQSANGYFVPAGGWTTLPINPGENRYKFTVLYTLPSPPVTQLMTVVYAPNEPVPDVATLGNSPIGIGGTVNTSTVNELINTGQAPGSVIINVQPSDAASNTWLADNSGNLTIKSDNAGTLALLLHLIAGASPSITVGQTGADTTIGGNLTINGTTFTAALQVFGQLTLQPGTTGIIGGNSLKLGQSAAGDILDGAGTNTFLKSANSVKVQIPNGTTQFTVDSTNTTVAGGLLVGSAATILTTASNTSVRSTGHIQLSTSTTDGDVLDAIPGGTTFLKGFSGISFQVPNGTTKANLDTNGIMNAVGFNLSTSGNTYSLYTNGISRDSSFSGTGSVTVNHNLGATPSWACAICSAAGSSQTQGITSNATQCTVTSGAALAWSGFALRF